ncbi:MAG: hypothetical protein PWQ66_1489 [Petrotoga sp.]|nr:hypothetical protein [Petrotoga sp.]
MGTGIPNISPLPKNLKLSGKSEMGIPSVYAKVKLLPIAIVANVTMKGWILPFDMTIPLNAPIAAIDLFLQKLLQVSFRNRG